MENKDFELTKEELANRMQSLEEELMQTRAELQKTLQTNNYLAETIVRLSMRLLGVTN